MNTAIPTQPALPPRSEAVSDGQAIASLVLGILGLTLLPVLGSLLAVIFGHSSRGAARQANRRASGLATTGVYLGWGGLIVGALIIVVIIVALSNQPDAYTTCVNNALSNGTDISACTP